MQNINKILIIRSAAIGDVIMATPLVSNLKKHFPKAKISFLIGDWSKQALKNNPNIDYIISYDDDIIIKKQIFKVLKLIRKIKSKKFDLCFILDKSWLWSLFAFLTQIPKRIGFSRGKEGFLNTKSIRFDASMHEVYYNLKLLELINKKPLYKKPSVYTTKKDKEYAKNFIKKIKNKAKIICLAPGGAKNPGQGLLLKRWPIDNYIDICDSFSKMNFIILGSKDDKGFAKEIIQKSKNKNIYDATDANIQQSKEIISLSDLVLCHDSGSMHIASTTDTKIIALFGPTPSKRFAPKNSISIQSTIKPTYDAYGKYEKKDYMKKITAKKVIDIIKAQLKKQ